jgi:hypothetical protein
MWRCAKLREETGYELTPDGELVLLGHYFSSPGFTDERGILSVRSFDSAVRRGPNREEGESILDCRGFTSEEDSSHDCDNEIRDANNAWHLRHARRSRSSLACAALSFQVRWRCETFLNFVIRRRPKRRSRF